jgi:hypothetical protein
MLVAATRRFLPQVPSILNRPPDVIVAAGDIGVGQNTERDAVMLGRISAENARLVDLEPRFQRDRALVA